VGRLVGERGRCAPQRCGAAATRAAEQAAAASAGAAHRGPGEAPVLYNRCGRVVLLAAACMPVQKKNLKECVASDEAW
jgi:hypothetical protein